jgi:hypothetical protein
VNYAAFMQVPDGIDDRTDNSSGFLLGIDFLFANFLIKLSAGKVLEHKIYVLAVTVAIVEFDDVGMVDIFHDVDFPLQQNLFLLVHFLSR